MWLWFGAFTCLFLLFDQGLCVCVYESWAVLLQYRDRWKITCASFWRGEMKNRSSSQLWVFRVRCSRTCHADSSSCYMTGGSGSWLWRNKMRFLTPAGDDWGLTLRSHRRSIHGTAEWDFQVDLRTTWLCLQAQAPSPPAPKIPQHDRSTENIFLHSVVLRGPTHLLLEWGITKQAQAKVVMRCSTSPDVSNQTL